MRTVDDRRALMTWLARTIDPRLTGAVAALRRSVVIACAGAARLAVIAAGSRGLRLGNRLRRGLGPMAAIPRMGWSSSARLTGTIGAAAASATGRSRALSVRPIGPVLLRHGCELQGQDAFGCQQERDESEIGELHSRVSGNAIWAKDESAGIGAACA